MCRHRRRSFQYHVSESLARLHRKVDKIMSQQDVLNAFVARIDTATTGIRQDIADLRAAHPEVDFTALEERVQGLEGLDAENPEPTPEPGA